MNTLLHIWPYLNKHPADAFPAGMVLSVVFLKVRDMRRGGSHE